MWRTKKQNGYTIVETMIVLAVTGTMLTATVILVSGQIERYRFKEISYNTQQALQGVINDVQTGYFGNQSLPTECAGVEGATNCIYVGKQIDILLNPNRIEATPLYMVGIDSSPGGASPVDVKPTTTNVTYLSEAFDLSINKPTFFVMFTRYQSLAPTVDFAGGSQSVFVTDAKNVLNSMTDPVEVCLDSGSRKAKLSVGGANYLSVKNEYVGSC